MSPSQPPDSPNPSLTEMKKEVSAPNPALPASRAHEEFVRSPNVADTSEINFKISQIEAIIKELSIDALLSRKEELENTLFILEKEHISGIASDDSYHQIKSKIIQELRKLDDRLAQVTAYCETNRAFRTEVPKMEEAISKIADSARMAPLGAHQSQEIESSLSELTTKYLAGQISEEVYYDLKAKLSVKLNLLER